LWYADARRKAKQEIVDNAVAMTTVLIPSSNGGEFLAMRVLVAFIVTVEFALLKK
jgi:hypothetical protein